MMPIDPSVKSLYHLYSPRSRHRHGACLLFAAVLVVVSVAGCGGAPDEAGSAGRGGDVSFAVTGAVDERFEGHATYTDASLELGMFSPALTDNRTFALDLSMRVGTGTPPPTGSYPIGRTPAADAFSAQLNLFEDGSFMNPTVYTAVADGGGTLEIASSSDDLVEGTFSFEAEHEDGSRISLHDGQFRAVQVRGGT